MKYQPKLEKEFLCPIEYGLDRFGGKWKSRILCVLSMREAMRYVEIKRQLANISDAVLAAMLKELQADDLIGREQFDEIPPRVEYRLSERGRSVLPILQGICRWSRAQAAEPLERRLAPCLECPQLGDHSQNVE